MRADVPGPRVCLRLGLGQPVPGRAQQAQRRPGTGAGTEPGRTLVGTELVGTELVEAELVDTELAVTGLAGTWLAGTALRLGIPATVSVLLMDLTPSGHAPKFTVSGGWAAAATGEMSLPGRARRFPTPRPAGSGRLGSRRPKLIPVFEHTIIRT